MPEIQGKMGSLVLFHLHLDVEWRQTLNISSQIKTISMLLELLYAGHYI
jgi:hypothetical protein